jgi:DNA-3-methyladenine glycosylase
VSVFVIRLTRIPRSFYSRYTPDVARDILGSVLVRVLERTRLSARIVEAEAYRGADDPASHAYRGVTKRTEVMFGEAGHAYVFFTYGNHYCFNITTEGGGEPGAVLIRAVAPVTGVDVMRARRGVEKLADLTNGPGKLTKAMAIDGSLNGEDVVTSKRLYLIRGEVDEKIEISSRIGLSVARETAWRYYLAGNPFVSHGRTHNYRTTSRTEEGSSASLVKASSLGCTSDPFRRAKIA